MTVILEMKGLETEQDRTKEQAAIKWVQAVNHHGGFGRWMYKMSQRPNDLPKQLEKIYQLANEAAETA